MTSRPHPVEVQAAFERTFRPVQDFQLIDGEVTSMGRFTALSRFAAAWRKDSSLLALFSQTARVTADMLQVDQT